VYCLALSIPDIQSIVLKFVVLEKKEHPASTPLQVQAFYQPSDEPPRRSGSLAIPASHHQYSRKSSCLVKNYFFLTSPRILKCRISLTLVATKQPLTVGGATTNPLADDHICTLDFGTSAFRKISKLTTFLHHEPSLSNQTEMALYIHPPGAAQARGHLFIFKSSYASCDGHAGHERPCSELRNLFGVECWRAR
jgi:hypothetical protein